MQPPFRLILVRVRGGWHVFIRSGYGGFGRFILFLHASGIARLCLNFYCYYVISERKGRCCRKARKWNTRHSIFIRKTVCLQLVYILFIILPPYIMSESALRTDVCSEAQVLNSFRAYARYTGGMEGFLAPLAVKHLRGVSSCVAARAFVHRHGVSFSATWPFPPFAALHMVCSLGAAGQQPRPFHRVRRGCRGSDRMLIIFLFSRWCVFSFFGDFAKH